MASHRRGGWLATLLVPSQEPYILGKESLVNSVNLEGGKDETGSTLSPGSGYMTEVQVSESPDSPGLCQDQGLQTNGMPEGLGVIPGQGQVFLPALLNAESSKLWSGCHCGA